MAALGVSRHGYVVLLTAVSGENPVERLVQSSRFVRDHEDLGTIHQGSSEDREERSQLPQKHRASFGCRAEAESDIHYVRVFDV